jgi:hypothetical protein
MQLVGSLVFLLANQGRDHFSHQLASSMHPGGLQFTNLRFIIISPPVFNNPKNLLLLRQYFLFSLNIRIVDTDLL